MWDLIILKKLPINWAWAIALVTYMVTLFWNTGALSGELSPLSAVYILKYI